jgi:hypothetical protein
MKDTRKLRKIPLLSPDRELTQSSADKPPSQNLRSHLGNHDENPNIAKDKGRSLGPENGDI